MSVTVVPKPTDDQRPLDQPDEDSSTDPVFDTAIIDNSDICSNCFARVRRDGTPVLDGIDGHDIETHDPHDALRTYPPRLTCDQCGVVGCGGVADTASKIQAVRRSRRLADRLEDQGFEPDRYRLREFVRRCKQIEQLGGYDTEIYRRAVRYALEETE